MSDMLDPRRKPVLCEEGTRKPRIICDLSQGEIRLREISQENVGLELRFSKDKAVKISLKLINRHEHTGEWAVQSVPEFPRRRP